MESHFEISIGKMKCLRFALLQYKMVEVNADLQVAHLALG